MNTFSYCTIICVVLAALFASYAQGVDVSGCQTFTVTGDAVYTFTQNFTFSNELYGCLRFENAPADAVYNIVIEGDGHSLSCGEATCVAAINATYATMHIRGLTMNTGATVSLSSMIGTNTIIEGCTLKGVSLRLAGGLNLTNNVMLGSSDSAFVKNRGNWDYRDATIVLDKNAISDYGTMFAFLGNGGDSTTHPASVTVTRNVFKRTSSVSNIMVVKSHFLCAHNSMQGMTFISSYFGAPSIELTNNAASVMMSGWFGYMDPSVKAITFRYNSMVQFGTALGFGTRDSIVVEHNTFTTGSAIWYGTSGIITFRNNTFNGMSSVFNSDIHGPVTFSDNTVSGLGSVFSSNLMGDATVTNNIISGLGSVFGSPVTGSTTVTKNTISGTGTLFASTVTGDTTVTNNTITDMTGSVFSSPLIGNNKVTNNIMMRIGGGIFVAPIQVKLNFSDNVVSDVNSYFVCCGDVATIDIINNKFSNFLGNTIASMRPNILNMERNEFTNVRHIFDSITAGSSINIKNNIFTDIKTVFASSNSPTMRFLNNVVTGGSVGQMGSPVHYLEFRNNTVKNDPNTYMFYQFNGCNADFEDNSFVNMSSNIQFNQAKTTELSCTLNMNRNVFDGLHSTGSGSGLQVVSFENVAFTHNVLRDFTRWSEGFQLLATWPATTLALDYNVFENMYGIQWVTMVTGTGSISHNIWRNVTGETVDCFGNGFRTMRDPLRFTSQPGYTTAFNNNTVTGFSGNKYADCDDQDKAFPDGAASDFTALILGSGDWSVAGLTISNIQGHTTGVFTGNVSTLTSDSGHDTHGMWFQGSGVCVATDVHVSNIRAGTDPQCGGDAVGIIGGGTYVQLERVTVDQLHAGHAGTQLPDATKRTGGNVHAIKFYAEHWAVQYSNLTNLFAGNSGTLDGTVTECDAGGVVPVWSSNTPDQNVGLFHNRVENTYNGTGCTPPSTSNGFSTIPPNPTVFGQCKEATYDSWNFCFPRNSAWCDNKCRFKDTMECNSWGDPHFVSYTRHAYDFQSIGEFVLTKTADFEVQTRQFQCNNVNGVTCNNAVAIRYKSTIITVYVDIEGSRPDMYINGSPQSAFPASPAAGAVEISNPAPYYVINIPDLGVTVRISYASVWVLDLYVDMPIDAVGSRIPLHGGVCGIINWNNKWIHGNGSAFFPSADPMVMHNFGKSWQIPCEQSHFDYAVTDQTCETVNPPVQPPPVYDPTPTGPNLDDALALCSSVREQIQCPAELIEKFYKSCVYDVMVTGSILVAQQTVVAFARACISRNESEVVLPTVSLFSIAYGPGLHSEQVTVGTPTYFYIQSVDALGRNQTSLMAQNDTYIVTITTLASGRTISSTIAHVAGTGIHNVSYTPFRYGKHRVDVRLVVATRNESIMGNPWNVDFGQNPNIVYEGCALKGTINSISEHYPTLNHTASKFTQDTVFAMINSDPVANRTFLGVTFIGATNPRCSFDEEHSVWDQTVNGCNDKFALALPWTMHRECGFTKDTTLSSSEFSLYHAKILMTYEDQFLITFGEHTTLAPKVVKRKVTTNYDVYVEFKSKVDMIIEEIIVNSDFNITGYVTEFSYNALTELLSVEITTLTQYPNRIIPDNMQMIVPIDMQTNGDLTLTNVACTEDLDTRCKQTIRFTANKTADCDFNGFYRFNGTGVTCRDADASSCTRKLVFITFDVFEHGVCGLVTADVSVDHELTAHAIQPTLGQPAPEPVDTFLIGEYAYFMTTLTTKDNDLAMRYKNIWFVISGQPDSAFYLYANNSRTEEGNMVELDVGAGSDSRVFALRFDTNIFRVQPTEYIIYTVYAEVVIDFDNNEQQTRVIRSEWKQKPKRAETGIKAATQVGLGFAEPKQFSSPAVPSVITPATNTNTISLNMMVSVTGAAAAFVVAAVVFAVVIVKKANRNAYSRI